MECATDTDGTMMEWPDRLSFEAWLADHDRGIRHEEQIKAQGEALKLARAEAGGERSGRQWMIATAVSVIALVVVVVIAVVRG